MLTNCNALSISHLKTTSQDLKKHTQMLTELRKDLDGTFKRISAIRTKIKNQYPDFEKSKCYIVKMYFEMYFIYDYFLQASSKKSKKNWIKSLLIVHRVAAQVLLLRIIRILTNTFVIQCLYFVEN